MSTPKLNARNGRVKHRYLIFLAEAKQLSPATVDQIAAAIADFEQSPGYREFQLFRPEQAHSYKHRLAKTINRRAGARLQKLPLVPGSPP